MKKTVAIFGGSGFLGRYVVQKFAQKGYNVKVLTRNPEEASFLKLYGFPGQICLFKGSVKDDSVIDNMIFDCDIVVNLIGILNESKKVTFKSMHTDFVERLANKLKKSDSVKFIHVSALSVDIARNSKYAKSKLEGEEKIRGILDNYCILRPSVIFGPEDNFVNNFAKIMSVAPCMPLFLGGKTKMQPIYVENVADIIVKVSENKLPKKIYELGGPNVMTLEKIFKMVKFYSNGKSLFIPLNRIISKILTMLMSILPTPPITLDQLKLLETDNIVLKNNITEDLDVNLTKMEDVLPSYLKRYN